METVDNVILNQLLYGVSFLCPMKTSENRENIVDFLIFSRDIKREHRAVTSQSNNKTIKPE